MESKIKNNEYECLSLVKKDIREKNESAWTLLFFTVILSVISVYIIAYYTFYPEQDISFFRKLAYGLAIICNTFCLGYISAFVFYYYHDYKPLASEILEDYQIAYAPIKTIYKHSKMIEETVFKDKIPSNDYEIEFADRIIVGKQVNGNVEINPVIWKMIRLNSSMIKECVNELKLVRSNIDQLTYITLSKSLDIYQQLSEKNWAFENEDSPNVLYEDLKLVLRNYKLSLEEYMVIMLNQKRYVYFDIE